MVFITVIDTLTRTLRAKFSTSAQVIHVHILPSLSSSPPFPTLSLSFDPFQFHISMPKTLLIYKSFFSAKFSKSSASGLSPWVKALLLPGHGDTHWEWEGRKINSSRSALATASFKKPAWAPGDSSQEIAQRKTLYPSQLAELPDELTPHASSMHYNVTNCSKLFQTT